MAAGPNFIASELTACYRGSNVSAQLFPSNGCRTLGCLHNRYLAVNLHDKLNCSGLQNRAADFTLELLTRFADLSTWTDSMRLLWKGFTSS
jgi:hypothetical protein